MSQAQHVNMAGMGGPVGGVAPPQQMNAPTPPNQSNLPNPADYVKKLNTYIYDYLLRNHHYEAARALCSETSGDTKPMLIKGSPDSRIQPNGLDDDSKDGLKSRPGDLMLPDLPSNDSAFLQDWWCQFWDIFRGQRNGGKPNTTQYLQYQRQIKTARNNNNNSNSNNNLPMDSAMNMRAYNMNMHNIQQQDLRKAAMHGKLPLNQAQLNQMRQGGQMPGADMQRSNSQMEGPRSGSPGPGGDAPSPKRQRLDGSNMQPMGQGRPGQPGNQVGLTSEAPAFILNSDPANQAREILLQHSINPDSIPTSTFQQFVTQPANIQHKIAAEHYKSVYSKSMSNSMQNNIQAVIDNANANMNKNMPPTAGGPMGPGAQGSPMSQPGLDGSEFYANGNGIRMPNAAQAAGNGQNGGNHALQDYQMQLMLLEQQNKKRLLMARQEQDSMAQPPMNGNFGPGMSPSAGRPGPSPGPGEMQRGTPKMGTSPNNMQGRNSPMSQTMNPELQARMMAAMQSNGMRNPSSHPASMEMFARNPQMMPNGAGMGPGPQQPGGMPGQVPPGQAHPNSTPRPANQTMPPPPAPPTGNASGPQPSSPAQPPAPPTPGQQSKAKSGGKKEGKGANKGGANKKGGNTAAATTAQDSEQPPTPTPATPITPIHANSFNQGQNKQQQQQQQQVSNGQGAQQQASNQQANNNNPQQQQQPQSAQPPQQQQNAVQAMGPDMEQFSMDGFNDMPFADAAGNTDLLDGFDFDSFLNNEESTMGFDPDSLFGGSGIEAGDGMNQ